MNNIKKPVLNDAGIERSVLSGILNHGYECLLEVSEILNHSDFYHKINRKIFSILQHMVNQNSTKTFDIPSIIATSKTIIGDNIIDGNKEYEFLEALFEEKISFENTLQLSTCVYKLSLARKAYLLFYNANKKILELKGNENINDIISIIEDPVFEFTGSLVGQENGLVSIGQDFQSSIKALSEDPKDIVGLPSGLPRWDKMIGGGLRPASVNVIGSRMKGGKSFICLNIARNVAENKIPVLYLDTELTRELQMHRLISLISGVELTSIESGQFSKNKETSDLVWSCQKIIEEMPITHHWIAGQSISSVLSGVRRWLTKNVGFNNSGKANPCLVVYDYIKLMDASDIKHNMAEFQLIGFLMTNLHNFATKWGIPILATVQLNRDGVTQEGGHVASMSDRIGWFCTSFSILKNKSQEELNEDPPANGRKKLLVTETRFGPGMVEGEYINIQSNLSVSKLSEGKLFSQNISEKTLKNKKI